MRIGAKVAIGAAGALLGGTIYSDWKLGRMAARVHPPGEWLRTEGVRLHFLSQGAGTAVVLLHASGLSLADFETSLLSEMAGEFRVTAFDRPGYGYSDAPPHENLTLGLNARLLHCALSQLGIRKPILLGHSSGGAVALRYAIEFPDELSGLVLLGPSCFAEGISLPKLFYLTETPLLAGIFLGAIYLPITELFAPAALAGLFAPGSPPPGYVSRMKPILMQPRQMRSWANELKHLPGGLSRQSPHYGEIRIPVAILAGEDDRFEPPKLQAAGLHRAIPESQLLVFPATGHAIHHQHPGAVIRAIRAVERHLRLPPEAD